PGAVRASRSSGPPATAHRARPAAPAWSCRPRAAPRAPAADARRGFREPAATGCRWGRSSGSPRKDTGSAYPHWLGEEPNLTRRFAPPSPASRRGAGTARASASMASTSTEDRQPHAAAEPARVGVAESAPWMAHGPDLGHEWPTEGWSDPARAGVPSEAASPKALLHAPRNHQKPHSTKFPPTPRQTSEFISLKFSRQKTRQPFSLIAATATASARSRQPAQLQAAMLPRPHEHVSRIPCN